MPIAEAIRFNRAGALSHLHELVTLEGTASSDGDAFYLNRPQKFFIQDARAGIALWGKEHFATVKAGDRVRVIGVIGQFCGAPEVEVREIAVTSHGAPPAPLEIAPEELRGHRYSGRLVRVRTVVIGSTAKKRGTNFVLRAGEDLVSIHLTAFQLTKISSMTWADDGAKIQVTGIASQYDVDPPYDSGWQILPRSAADMVLLQSPPLKASRVLAGAAIGLAALGVALLAVIILRRQVGRQTERLSESEERYRLTFERNLAGLYRTAMDGTIAYCNDACARLFGLTPAELQGRNVRDFYADLEQLRYVARQLQEKGSTTDVELCLRRPDGTEVWALATATVTEDSSESERQIDGALIDITERKRAVQQMEFLAYHDVMTGLPNRALFRDRLELALALARREAAVLAVLFLDLDRFKRINDTLGHSAGDAVLKLITARLNAAVRGGDTVARLGGDEFAILLRLTSIESARLVARKILSAIDPPMEIASQTLHVTASIGVALHPADGEDVETLLRNADVAMYRAKESGRNRVEYVSSAEDAERALDRLAMENDLHRVLQRRGLEVWYQPLVHTRSGQVTGAEALVRWFDRRRGAVDTATFVSLAEESGLIDDLGMWVLIQACAQRRAWSSLVDPEFRLAINISAHQLRDASFSEFVRHTLISEGLDPAAIELEVTESTALSKQLQSGTTLEALRNLGVGVAIDDFGTGHSTLTTLRQLPVTTIKIDRSFVSRITSDASDAAIVAGLISMAHRLGCRVIAEGIETAEQLQFLRENHCDEYQGYHFSAAVPAQAFTEILIRQHSSPAEASTAVFNSSNRQPA